MKWMAHVFILCIVAIESNRIQHTQKTMEENGIYFLKLTNAFPPFLSKMENFTFNQQNVRIETNN